jgi:outer membrane protein assembly factor BamB
MGRRNHKGNSYRETNHHTLKLTKYILTVVTLAFMLSAKAQTTYNNSFVLVQGSHTGYSLSEIDGVLKCTSSHLINGRFLVCLSDVNEEGELLNTLCYGYDEAPTGFLTGWNGVSLLSAQLIQCGQVLLDEETQGGYYHVFDAAGNVMRYAEMENPWYEDTPQYSGTPQILPRDWILLEDGTVIFTYSGISSSATFIDTGIICYDGNDIFQWYHDWRTEEVERAYAVTTLNNEVYVAIETWPTDWVIDNEIAIHRFSMDGELLQTYTEEMLVEGFGDELNLTNAKEMIADEEALVMVGSIVGEPGYTSDVAITKFDSALNLLWSSFIDMQWANNRQEFTNVCITTDGNYVAIASVTYDLPQPDPVFGTEMDDALVAKFNSENGELIWQRYYRYTQSDDRRNDVYDVCATSDGGVAFTGTLVDYTQEVVTIKDPFQKGWIAKLDEYGCLVPGCQNVGVEEQEEQKTYFTFGPNPLVSGSTLNVYLGNYNGRAPRFVVYDQQGKEVASTAADGMNTTYMWVLPELAGGSYVLVLEDQGRVVQSELLVVE